MKCSVFLLAILMATLLDWCCALMPVTGESGNRIATPEEVTMDTWQYCIVDNSTILRLDTGEQLDIVYTSNNTLLVILNHSQTVLVLPRLYNDKLGCGIDDLSGDFVLPNSAYVSILVWSLVALSVSGRNIVIHVFYKKLNNPMGKLLMWYSIFLILRSICFFIMITLQFKLSSDFHNVHVCHFAKLAFITVSIGYEAIATCILMHTAHSLRQTDKMQPVDPSKYKIFIRCYFWYVTCTVVISMFIILTYDLGMTKRGYSRYCDRDDPIYQNMIIVKQTIFLINKVAQIALFIIYLYYWRKLRSFALQTDKKLFDIAIGMGATISISEFAYILSRIIVLATGNLSALLEVVGSVMLILQHCIITGLLKRLRKACSCKKEVIVTN